MQTHPRQVLSFSPKQTAINTVFSAIGIQDCKVRKKKPTVDGLSHIKVMLLPGSCSNREIAQAAGLVSHKLTIAFEVSLSLVLVKVFLEIR